MILGSNSNRSSQFWASHLMKSIFYVVACAAMNRCSQPIGPLLQDKFLTMFMKIAVSFTNAPNAVRFIGPAATFRACTIGFMPLWAGSSRQLFKEVHHEHHHSYGP